MTGFDFTSAVRAVCDDMSRRVEELSHIDMSLVAVGFCQARKRVSHGLQASLTPLRFEGGSQTKQIGRRRYGCQQLLDSNGREYLYLLQFYLPRFLDHPLEEKLTTIVHELWHIAAEFDGDLRRHEGRCYIHGHSQREFDDQSGAIARKWLAADPPPGLYDFLNQNFAELVAEHGSVRGQKFPAPKLVPLDAA